MFGQGYLSPPPPQGQSFPTSSFVKPSPKTRATVDWFFYVLEHSWALIHSVERYHTGLCTSSVSPGPTLLFQMGLSICVLDCFWISHNFQGNAEFIKIVAILLTNGAPPRTQIATVCSSLDLVIRLFLRVTSWCRTFVLVFGGRVFLHTTQAGLELTMYLVAANRSLINLSSQKLALPE